MLYSDNSIQNTAEVADNLSKCSIKEVEKPNVDRGGGVPVTRLPIQVPQTVQGLMIDLSILSGMLLSHLFLSLPLSHTCMLSVVFSWILSQAHSPFLKP